MTDYVSHRTGEDLEAEAEKSECHLCAPIFTRMESNQRVTARLTRVEEDGLYAEAEGQPILILIPETSWTPIVLRESFSVGEEVEVFLLRFVPQQQTFLGSLRALQENPYQSLPHHSPEEILTGRVRRIDAEGVYVQLSNSAWGELPRATLPGTVAIGDELPIQIAWVDPPRGRMGLRRAGKTVREPKGHTGPTKERKLLSPEMEQSLARRFPTAMSPEEFAARKSHTIICFGLHEVRFRDVHLDQWMQRVGEILTTPGLRDYYRRQLLTPEEYQRILAEEAQVH